MPIKAFMIPQTVPKRPTNGPTEPMVANMPVPDVILLLREACVLSKLICTRSLMPSLLAVPKAESSNSCNTVSVSAKPPPFLSKLRCFPSFKLSEATNSLNNLVAC